MLLELGVPFEGEELYPEMKRERDEESATERVDGILLVFAMLCPFAPSPSLVFAYLISIKRVIISFDSRSPGPSVQSIALG